jgi:beta-glucanase (GH16 family)
MKSFAFKLFIYITITTLLYSCNDKKEKKVTENKKTSTERRDWNLVWSEEFDDNQINQDNWNFQEVKAGRFNEEWQRYTAHSENAYVEDNCLIIEARHESDDHGMNQYTSARLNTANKQSWKYGKFSARIKLPEGEGIWPAFWMLGANIDENGGDTPWPQCGELDILELYGSKDDGAIEVNAHYTDSTDSHANMGAKSYILEQGKFSDDFHIFDLEWTKDSLTWFVDGNEVASMPINKPYLSEFHKPFFILLNIAVGGTFAGRPDDTTEFPQKMYVDWIRVYQK